METRKLQQVGGGTFTVSIPKDWATDHALEAGAEVHLYTHSDGSVVVRSAERDGGHLEGVTLDADGFVSPGDDGTSQTAGTPDAGTADDDPAPVVRLLRAAQTVGFEAVTLTSEAGFTDEQRRAVRSAVGTLVGTELVVERSDELRVRNLLDASDVSVRQSVVQLQYVALSIHRAATAAFVDGEGAADRLADRADEADRLFGMVARHCHRSLTSLEALDCLGVTRPELFEYYETARQLRNVAREGVRIARVADRLPAPPADPVADAVADLGERARDVVDDAANAVLGGAGVATAHAALDGRDAVRTGVAAVDDALFASAGAPVGRDPDPGADTDTDAGADTDTDAGADTDTDASAGADTDTDADPALETDGSPARGIARTLREAGEAPGTVALARVLDPLSRTADHGGRIAHAALRGAVRAEK